VVFQRRRKAPFFRPLAWLVVSEAGVSVCLTHGRFVCQARLADGSGLNALRVCRPRPISGEW
jgi:hypothetical protein